MSFISKNSKLIENTGGGSLAGGAVKQQIHEVSAKLDKEMAVLCEASKHFFTAAREFGSFTVPRL